VKVLIILICVVVKFPKIFQSLILYTLVAILILGRGVLTVGAYPGCGDFTGKVCVEESPPTTKKQPSWDGLGNGWQPRQKRHVPDSSWCSRIS